MASKMLVDAAHPEETRVVVVRGNKIEEFDYESAQRKQLKGNIYLAKVTRVEPSLQAAFVDYGGNRHGFLAFSEIHPDYYQIPVADRQALLQQEQDDARRNDDDFDDDDDDEDGKVAAGSDGDDAATDDDTEENGQRNGDGIQSVTENAEDASVDSVGAEDAMEELPKRQRSLRRSYKIQEVIKRRQVILVQVVKEERGNKGAALTTYLSLAGRYCVLMPNTARGGGISRKITDAGDRRRLKDVAKGIEVPEGMGLIVRTAGAKRTKPEIKRDFDYLLRLWENVRDLTLESTAPSLVYEEGNLIKRSIRDLYTKDVDEVLVEGEAAHHEAKSFMKMLMPSHARNVKLYKETRPLFSRNKVDAQLDSLFSPTVTLQSGGYMVMNQTEALVAVDINSGKSTREHSIEDTALRTNLEAAEEIARQLRLRDLAGLIVIDFIDMEEKRNNRAVERKLKEALKHDRARIQVGRISHFGLLEMSRQRLRQGMLENSTKLCQHCEGTGLIRSLSSCALSVLRKIEEYLINSRKPENLTVRCEREIGFYILNEKRDHLLGIEAEYGISIFLVPDSDVVASDCEIERGAERTVTPRKAAEQTVKIDSAFEDGDDDDAVAEAEEEPARAARTGDDNDEEQPRKRRRRRGRRGGRRSRERSDEPDSGVRAEAGEEESGTGPEDTDMAAGNGTPPDKEVKAEAVPEAVDADAAIVDAAPPVKPKRARKPRKQAKDLETDAAETAPAEVAAATVEAVATAPLQDLPEEKPKAARKPRKSAKKPAKPTGRKKTATATPEIAAAEPGEAAPVAALPHEAAEVEPAPPQVPSENGHAEAANAEQDAPERKWTPPQQTEKPAGPTKSGWWSRR